MNAISPVTAGPVPDYIADHVRMTAELRAQMRSPRRVPDPFCAPCPDCRGAGTRASGAMSEAGAIITSACGYCGGIGTKEGSLL